MLTSRRCRESTEVSSLLNWLVYAHGGERSVTSDFKRGAEVCKARVNGFSCQVSFMGRTCQTPAFLAISRNDHYVEREESFFAATGQLDVHLQVEVARPCFQSAAAFRDPIRARGFRRDQTLHVEPSYAWARNRFRHGLATLIRRSDSSEAAAVVHELRQVEAPQQCDEADRNNAIVIVQRSSQWLGMCGLFGITNQQTKSGGQRITR